MPVNVMRHAQAPPPPVIFLGGLAVVVESVVVAFRGIESEVGVHVEAERVGRVQEM